MPERKAKSDLENCIESTCAKTNQERFWISSSSEIISQGFVSKLIQCVDFVCSST